MAEKIIRVCDYGHAEDEDVRAESTESFNVDGIDRRIDLCYEHGIQFKAFLAQQQMWADAAHVDSDAPVSTRQPRVRDPEAAAIRQWARQQGFTIGKNGRINKGLREQYERRDQTVRPFSLVPAESPPG